MTMSSMLVTLGSFQFAEVSFPNVCSRYFEDKTDENFHRISYVVKSPDLSGIQVS